MSSEATASDLHLIEDIVSRISTNLSILVDRSIAIQSVESERANERVAGSSQVHISFKLRFTDPSGDSSSGCVLVPLPDALSLAAYLMMASDAEAEAQRSSGKVDQAAKDAILELGNFVSAAVDESMRIRSPGTRVRSAGCQGVRADVRPAFEYEEGSELLVGRADMQIHDFPGFELIALLPGCCLDG